VVSAIQSHSASSCSPSAAAGWRVEPSPDLVLNDPPVRHICPKYSDPLFFLKTRLPLHGSLMKRCLFQTSFPHESRC
jgi:hypothetical protein